MGDFDGKVVLVTGASSGIGAACARLFAAEGAAVVLVARRREVLEAVASEIDARGGRAAAVVADVSSLEACRWVVEEAHRRFGGLDILVNNAGVNFRGPIERFEADQLAAEVAVNLSAPIVLARLALPRMRERGGGSIVNVASIAGKVPVAHEAVYCATKAGLRAFTFALSAELEGSGIHASVVSPGPVATDFILGDLDHVPDLIFANPMSSAEEVARLVLMSAKDGRPERTIPVATGYLATVGNLFPRLRKLMVPLLERRGKKVKERYRSKLSSQSRSLQS